jgi:NitT/TauT family transport system substrate-binding protein
MPHTAAQRHEGETMKRRNLLIAAALATAALANHLHAARAQETQQVRVAKQFGISYLPMILMEDKGLLERHLQKAGLGNTKVTWTQLAAGPPMNEALLSGNLDFASGGVGPLVTIWDRTRGNLNVHGVAAMNSMPLYLNTINPAVRSLKDLTDNDRIALPAVKVSMQAVTLQMAAEKELGRFDALDRLTVSMSHPDGMAAMMSGRSEITAHFTSAPFMYQELADQRVRRIVSSYEVAGGPCTFNVIWATARFREQNPRTYRAFLGALEEAIGIINSDKKAAAALYIAFEKSRLTQEFVEKILDDPENVFTTAPQRIMRYAEFLQKVGSIKQRPGSWKDLFFPEIHDRDGS